MLAEHTDRILTKGPTQCEAHGSAQTHQPTLQTHVLIERTYLVFSATLSKRIAR